MSEPDPRQPITPLVSWLVFGLAWVLLMLCLASLLGGCAPRTCAACEVDNGLPDAGPVGSMPYVARAICLDSGGAYVTITEPGRAPISYCTYSGILRN